VALVAQERSGKLRPKVIGNDEISVRKGPKYRIVVGTVHCSV
jgi:hypothetical protein